MEDESKTINSEQQNQNPKEEFLTISKSLLKKFAIGLGIAFLAIFLASFLAFYLVFQQLTKNSHITYLRDDFFDGDRFMTQMNEEFNNLEKQNQNFIFHHPFILKEKDFPNYATIKTENNPTDYKVIINLKSFGNNEKNVNVKTEDNRLTIQAKYENKDKNHHLHNSSSFYQTVGLSEKINPSKIIKEKNGDMLTITIPKTISKTKQ